MVITSSVLVNTRHTVLVDPLERELQYLESLSFFIRETPFQRIIICDGSGYAYPKWTLELAAEHEKQLELLSFEGNKEAMGKHGKGYGEGEIMKYVLAKSRLMPQAEGFLKITGRLKLVNVEEILRRADHRKNYFMPISLIRPRWLLPVAARPCVEVQVYYATKAFFRDVLLDAYLNVSDDKKYFLEHAYHDAIAASQVKVQCFPMAPEITGVSGSNGWPLKERPYWKRLLIRGISYLPYIRPIYRR